MSKWVENGGGEPEAGTVFIVTSQVSTYRSNSDKLGNQLFTCNDNRISRYLWACSSQHAVAAQLSPAVSVLHTYLHVCIYQHIHLPASSDSFNLTGFSSSIGVKRSSWRRTKSTSMTVTSSLGTREGLLEELSTYETVPNNQSMHVLVRQAVLTVRWTITILSLSYFIMPRAERVAPLFTVTHVVHGPLGVFVGDDCVCVCVCVFHHWGLSHHNPDIVTMTALLTCFCLYHKVFYMVFCVHCHCIELVWYIYSITCACYFCTFILT